MKNLLFIGLVAGGVGALAINIIPPSRPAPVTAYDVPTYRDPEFRASVERIDTAFHQAWGSQGITPANPAPDLAVARRLALALMGTVPSLEEIRQFEALPPDQRLNWYLDRILADSRFNDYLAERLTRAYVGTEDGPFLLFRRRRFVTWISDQLAAERPYDRLAYDLIATDGVWTDHPATNFITVTAQQDKGNKPDPVRLAARVTRGFLGLRLDCAQCHDDRFTKWVQRDFEGLSAFFGRTDVTFRGVQDTSGEYEVEDRKSQKMRAVDPKVPYSPELMPSTGTRREQLAAWVTHPKNPYFSMAIANRMWALMFGKPLVEPVDNLDPKGDNPPVLKLLADDFVAHGHDLRRLIRVIASTQAFRLDSASERDVSEKEEKAWAVFPLTRLRPEQVAGSVWQAASVTTLDAETHILTRLIKVLEQRDFITRYGDSGADEFENHGGTIPQRLLLMNGKLVRERTNANPMNATARIEWFARTHAKAVETAYLTILTRRPTPEEAAHFEAFLAETDGGRPDRMADLYWALVNSTEFSWNH